MKFPARVFIKIERDSDQEFMHASAYPEDHAEYGKKIRVAEYKLARTIKLKTVVKKQ